MNKIKIMEAAVKKWQRIIDKKGSDGGVLDCPPCRSEERRVGKEC